jgi:hypothetical protein
VERQAEEDWGRSTMTEALARNAEPWRLPLERLRGKVADDGIERISTQAIFTAFWMCHSATGGAGACRRLAKLMRDPAE